ncbi:MAG: sialate O-acetylesterase [Verrucomicrobiota bacterium]|jgi:sialate O-acetylesterase
MPTSRIPLLALAVLTLGTLASAADLRLPAAFSDHMVLQRDKAVAVWGWADADEEVSVEFAGQKKAAKADASGKWFLRLDPLTASAESRKLTATGKDGRKAEVSDVLVGDVWLGSGQSNMAMTVNRAKDFEQEKAAATFPLIRHFKEESAGAASAQSQAKGKWLACTPDNVGGFGATLYFFGREIHREIGVPIGLINTSVGGTPIESWIAPEVQETKPALKAALEAQSAALPKIDPEKAKADYAVELKKFKAAKAKAVAEGTKVPRPPRNAAEVSERKGSYGQLFNGKVAPLVPYTLKGMLWYQGEANSSDTRAPLYVHQLSALVTDWRARWGEELPFAWVQLPNFTRPGEGWPLMREAMLKTLSLPKTGMAVTIDIGEAKDIHPKNKQDVGRRLSLWALGEVYGRKVVAASGPLPAGHEIKGAEVVVTLTHAEGLKTRDGAPVKGFQLAGTDKQWKPATARIDGTKLVVTSAEVAAPVALRYAWLDFPETNLVNSADLPASPFRTDDWAPVSLPAPAAKGKGKTK